jgi:anti-anti-sigma factor
MSAPSRLRWLEAEVVGDVTVVRIRRHRILALEEAEEIGRELSDLVQIPGCHKVVVHLGKVESMTTMMLSRLLALHRQVEADGGRLVLCNAGPYLTEVFTLLQLRRVVPVYDGELEALQSFPGTPARSAKRRSLWT